jgi:hypothetical protein
MDEIQNSDLVDFPRTRAAPVLLPCGNYLEVLFFLVLHGFCLEFAFDFELLSFVGWTLCSAVGIMESSEA